MSLARHFKAIKRLWRIKGRNIDLAVLRLFIKFIPSESQRVFALTILIGAVCGFAAVAFHLAISLAETNLIDRAISAHGYSWIFWTIATPTLGGLFGGFLLQYVVPEARGSGIPQVKLAYTAKGGKLSFLNSSLGKFFIGAIQIGSGASLGREGPTVQICCGIASFLGRAAALSRDNLKRLLPVGAAAGIAAAFNAPIAAVTFTIEEIVGDLDQTILSGIVIAAALAAAIERGILGEHPIFDVPTGYGLHHISSILFYVILGVAAAFISLAFSESLLKLRSFFQKDLFIPIWMRPSIGGLVTGVLAVCAIYWLKSDGLTGGGYSTLSRALSGNLALHILISLCVMKLIATVFSYSSGGAGGIFAPALFIGGALGGAVGFLDVSFFHHANSEIGAFALVGMGAVFAGIVRAPITSVLIIFEMTGSYGLILPLMISNMMSYGLARHFRPTPIYEALLEQDGVFLPERRKMTNSFDNLSVTDAMTKNPVTLFAELTVEQTLKNKDLDKYSNFPIVDSRNRFVGFATRARLRRTLAEGNGSQKVKEMIYGSEFIISDKALVNAVIQMSQADVRQLAVLDYKTKELIGIITMSDIIRFQAQNAINSIKSNPNDSEEYSETTVLLKSQAPNR